MIQVVFLDGKAGGGVTDKRKRKSTSIRLIGGEGVDDQCSVLVVTVAAKRRRIGRRVHQIWRYGPVGRIPETGAGHVGPGAGRTSAFTPIPQLPHFVPPLAHQRLVLGYPHFLAIHNACPLWSGTIPVVRVLLHVQLGQPRLFLIVRLFVRVRHRLPPGSCAHNTTVLIFIIFFIHPKIRL